VITLVACSTKEPPPPIVTEMPSTPPQTVVEPTPTPVAEVVTPPATPTGSEWKDGVRLYESREYAAAAEQLEVAAQQRSDATSHYLLGLARWKAGQNERAGAALERAAQLAPDSTRTWINLARVRMSLEQPGGALTAAESALAIEPGSGEALHQRGRALAALGRAGEAIESLEQARQAAPGNGQIANTLGWVLLQAGRPEEALPILEGARELLPDVAYLRNNLAVAYERTGRLAEAFEEYQAAVRAGDSAGKAAASVARLEPLVTRRTGNESAVAQLAATDAD
jgi:tetratricopeptide (TPR) repeat protein